MRLDSLIAAPFGGLRARRPKPLEDGDQAHLTAGSIRWYVAGGMRLGACVAGVTTQYVALLDGSDVVLTREQVAGFVPAGQHPANLNDHPQWTLSGGDVLTPVT